MKHRTYTEVRHDDASPPGPVAVTAATFAAVVAAYLVGTLAACYETTLVIGSLPASDVLLGFRCGAAYLLFAVALAAAASLARTVLGTVGFAIGALLILPILGSFSVLDDGLPSPWPPLRSTCWGRHGSPTTDRPLVSPASGALGCCC